MAIATREAVRTTADRPHEPTQALGPYSTVCPHMGGPLDQGTIQNGEVTCPWHRYRFEVSTGQGRGMARLLGLCLRRRAEDTCA